MNVRAAMTMLLLCGIAAGAAQAAPPAPLPPLESTVTAPAAAGAPLPPAPPPASTVTAPAAARAPLPLLESTVTAPAPCLPACGPGLSCLDGRCQPACNPPCLDAEECTPQGICALRPLPPSPREQERAARAQTRAVALKARAERRAVRMHHRALPRLLVAGGLALGFVDRYHRRHGGVDVIGLYAGQLGVGLRRNFRDHFGAQAKLNVSLGTIAVPRDSYPRDEATAEDSAPLRDFSLEGGLFANFWYLYAGPIASIGHRSYGKSALQLFDGAYDLDQISGVHSTVGGQIGLLLLLREQIDLSVRLQVDLQKGVPQLLLTAAYHFLPPS